MAYPILSPRHVTPEQRAARAGRCALAVMAKAPRAGRVKTRLSPPLTLAQTAALNICFLRDTTENLVALCKGREADALLCYTPVGEESTFDGILPESFPLVPQRGVLFGERLLCASEDILALGYAAVCLIDSDSPTVPAAAFIEAITLLTDPTATSTRAVLGPSDDGGYYLIGLRHPHPEPFTNITWSTAVVAQETRAHSGHLDLHELPLWYDVDDAPTLDLLRSELLDGVSPPFATQPGYPAPATRAFLAALQAVRT